MLIIHSSVLQNKVNVMRLKCLLSKLRPYSHNLFISPCTEILHQIIQFND